MLKKDISSSPVVSRRSDANSKKKRSQIVPGLSSLTRRWVMTISGYEWMVVITTVTLIAGLLVAGVFAALVEMLSRPRAARSFEERIALEADAPVVNAPVAPAPVAPAALTPAVARAA
jgi:hypothetical protein